MLNGARRTVRNGPVDIFRYKADVSQATRGQPKRARRVIEFGESQADFVALHCRLEATAHQLLGNGSSERGRGRGYCGQQCPARGGETRQFGPGHPGIKPSAFAHPAIVWLSRGDRFSLWHGPRNGVEVLDHVTRLGGRRHSGCCSAGDSGHHQPDPVAARHLTSRPCPIDRVAN